MGIIIQKSLLRVFTLVAILRLFTELTLSHSDAAVVGAAEACSYCSLRGNFNFSKYDETIGRPPFNRCT